MSVISLLGTALGAVGTLSQIRGARRQEQRARQNQELVQQQNKLQARQIRDKTRRDLASKRVRFAGAGVAPAGTPLEVLSAIAEAGLDEQRQNAISGGRRGIAATAGVDRARQSATQGSLRLGRSLLGSVGGFGNAGTSLI